MQTDQQVSATSTNINKSVRQAVSADMILGQTQGFVAGCWG